MKNKEYLIVCDSCKHQFEAQSVKIKKQSKVKEGVLLVKQFFLCPNCKKEYITDVTDTKIRSEIKHYKKLVGKQKKLIANNAEKPLLEEGLKLLTEQKALITNMEANLRKRW